MEVLPVVDFSVWLIVKIMFLFAILIYVIFAFVVVRQVRIMTETLEVGFETPIRTIAWAHLFFAVATFILALIVL